MIDNIMSSDFTYCFAKLSIPNNHYLHHHHHHHHHHRGLFATYMQAVHVSTCKHSNPYSNPITNLNTNLILNDF